AIKLAAFSFLECMLVTACMYVGCRLVDDVVAIARFQSLDPLYEIPILVFLSAVARFLTALTAVHIVYMPRTKERTGDSRARASTSSGLSSLPSRAPILRDRLPYGGIMHKGIAYEKGQL
ncbi:MAG: hypothetical protein LM580_11270, partial [Thermofilum sp.]|nr:hypothetical protein [Thermofilum sp.]